MTTPVTGSVLVLLDHAADGVLRQPALELLTAARSLGAVHGAWVAGADGAGPDARTLELLGTYGAETVHRLDLGDADARLTPVVAQGLTALLQRTGASVLLLTSSFENKEIAARVGVATGAGVVVDASALEVAGDRVVAAKTVFAGTWNTRCAVRTPLGRRDQPAVSLRGDRARAGEHGIRVIAKRPEHGAVSGRVRADRARLPADRDGAAVRVLQPGDQPERCRLAAAGRPEQRDELAAFDREADAVDGGCATPALRNSLELYRNHSRPGRSSNP